MYELLTTFGLYALGMFLGFMSIPFFVRFKRMDEREAIDFDESYNLILLVFNFMEEVDEAPDSCLNEEELKGLRDKVLHYEIPYLQHQVVMFYDSEKEAFCYYSNSTIIYKYLNVVARKYVLTHECKQIYKEMVACTKKEEKTVTFGPFVPKVGKTTLEKDMNRFLYLGNLHDYKPALPEPNRITFSEYREQMAKTKALSSSTPDSQWTKID